MHRMNGSNTPNQLNEQTNKLQNQNAERALFVLLFQETRPQ